MLLVGGIILFGLVYEFRYQLFARIPHKTQQRLFKRGDTIQNILIIILALLGGVAMFVGMLLALYRLIFS